MPDINFPKVTMADEDLSKLFGREKHQTRPARRWTCSADSTIAAYVDGALPKLRKSLLELHLAKCQRCRLVVADVLKGQRETELPLLPAELRWKAIGAAKPTSVPGRWIWVPAGAMATVALLAGLAIIMRTPEQLVVQSPPSPSAPLIAKFEPTVVPHNPVRNIERKRTPEEPLPNIVFPPAQGVVSRERLQFEWKPIPHSRYYQVRVVTSDGDLVWEGQTEKPDVQPPLDLPVRDGSYFVWVTAYLADGRIAKSPPVKFVIKR